MARTKFPTVPIAEVVAKGLSPDVTPPPPLILVVDDERSIADTLSLILQSAGFAAAACYGGVDALEIARVIPPDLLLTDIVMPGMNGVELALEVSRLVPDCQVLLISATVDRLSGTNGHQFKLLAKPIHPVDLLGEVARLLTPPHPERAPVYEFRSASQPKEKADRENRPTGTGGCQEQFS